MLVHFSKSGAGNEARTRDLNLGKVALYQLSYSRAEAKIIHILHSPHGQAQNPVTSSVSRKTNGLNDGRPLGRVLLQQIGQFGR